MCIFLIHIHVLTCVNVLISMGHVTTQNKSYFDVFSMFVSSGNAILSPTHGQQLLLLLYMITLTI